ncbi:hypothetical protein MKEN_00488900 [Mycena kentingensis (nom. inval.)]|nr:hypothetical protein MKEN_00488900 [Mycena kentingensis (nom. inval.)]
MDPQHGQPSLPPYDPSCQPHSFPAPGPLPPTLSLNDGSGSLGSQDALGVAQDLAYMSSSGLTQEDLQMLYKLARQHEFQSPTPIPNGDPLLDVYPLHTYTSPNQEHANEFAAVGAVDAGYQHNASGVGQPAYATHQDASTSEHGVASYHYPEFPDPAQSGLSQSYEYISNGALAANDYSNVPGYAGAYEREPYIHGQPTRATPSSSYHAGPPCAGPSNDGPSQQRQYHQEQPHASPAHDLRPQIPSPQDIVDGNGPYPFTFGASMPLAAGGGNYDQLARDENYTYPADVQQPYNGAQAGPAARIPMTLSNGIPDSSSQPAAEKRPLKQPIPPKRRLPGARRGRKRKISEVDDAPTGALPRLSQDEIKAYTTRTTKGSTYVCLYAPGTSTENAHECLSVEYATRHDIAIHLGRAHDFPGRLVLYRDGPANPQIPCLWEVIQEDGRRGPCDKLMTQDEVPRHIFTEHLGNVSGGQIMECERFAQCGTALPVQQLRGHMKWCRPVPEYPAPFTKRFE